MVNKDLVDTIVDLKIRELIITSILKHGLFGPTKQQIVKEKEKAIKKREMCIRIYIQCGKKWAEYHTYDTKGKEIIWQEEIKEDPFNLY